MDTHRHESFPRSSRGDEALTRSLLAGLLCLSLLTPAATAQQTQQIGLAQGWNLISVQVGPSFPVASVQAALSNSLLSVWSYDAAAHEWSSFQATNASYPHNLSTLEPGRGYWFQMSSAATLTLTGASWGGTVPLQPGWNLVGFPGLASGSGAPHLSSVFRTNLARLPQIWTYDAAPTQRKFVGYDTQTLPPLTNLTTIEAGKGYWVRSLDALAIAPVPEIILSGDIDIPPLQSAQPNGTRLAGTEDIAAGTDLNGNGLLDDPFTQDTLLFKEGISQQLITVANSGLGLVDWSASEEVSWLALNGTNNVSGVVASESDYLTVTVDRTGLKTGTYTASFPVQVGAFTRLLHVTLRVAPADGDYRGFAATKRVNGRNTPLGKVDLNLTIFRDGIRDGTNDLRAVINSDRSLLFPRDVFLTGTFYQDNDFFLSSNFEVPAGDRNAPPYETFQHGHSYTKGSFTSAPDIDRNGDQILDNQNPYPFSLRREITLIGRRINENQFTGAYYESIQNVLPNGQRIFIEGEFQLDRLTLTPTLTSIYNRTVSTNVIIGQSTPAALTNAINVPASVSVQGVSVSVSLDFALGSSVTVSLVAPGTNGLSYVLSTDAFSGTRTFDLTAFNGINGAGTWKLIVRWLPNGERGFFQGWSLNVKGLAVYQATGLVVTGPTNAPVPVSGARVTLVGNNFVDQRFTATSGAFTFTNLTENDFTLTVSRVGYQEAARGFSILNANTNVGSIYLLPVTNTEPVLVAAPNLGGQPLTVNFSTILPLTLLNGLGVIQSNVWVFGDGTRTNFSGTIAPEVEHTYTAAGYFTATNFIYGSLASTTLVSRLLTVLPQGPLPGLPQNLWGIGFIGSVASPIQPIVEPFESETAHFTNQLVIVNGVTRTLTNVPTAAVKQNRQRDVAGFDLDRFPLGNFTGAITTHPEDTDFFVQPSDVPAGTPPTDGQFTLFPHLAVVNNPTNRFRMSCTMGGYVFGEHPSRVAQYNLQPSRLEP